MTTIYGIKNCSTMKKAFDKLNQLGVTYEFFDYKKQPIREDKIQTWVDKVGIDKLLNKKGMTWRNLSDKQKQFTQDSEQNAIKIMAQNPSMIKRPIIEVGEGDNTTIIVGFDETQYQTLQK